MIRLDRYKYVHYVGYPAQLFDLEEDPEELVDRGGDPALEGVRREARARLEAMLDPAAVDAAAKARQRELLAANGGREAVIARGDLGFSVPPGVAPMFD
jgi:choline-sulfatase